MTKHPKNPPVAPVASPLTGAFWQNYWRKHRPKPAVRVFLVRSTDGFFAVDELKPNEETILMTVATVGHTVTYTIVEVDTSGNDMLTQTPVDASPAPAWTSADAGSSPAVDSLSVSADGSTGTVSCLAAGNDSIGVTVHIGGVAYSATDQLEIDAAPQVLGGIRLKAVVSA